MENVIPQENSNVRKAITKNPIVVSRVYKGDFQSEAGELQAELKQTVETKSFYPSKTVGNDLQSSPFKQEEFGFKEKEFSTARVDVTWIIVPAGTTQKEVEDRIAMNPNATLYRILSNYPIITSDQESYIDSIYSDQSMSMEERKKAAENLRNKIANRQVLRYAEDDNRGRKKGELILDSLGRPQYKACFFSPDGKEDVDKRVPDFTKFYATPEIQKELELSNQPTVLTTQSL